MKSKISSSKTLFTNSKIELVTMPVVYFSDGLVDGLFLDEGHGQLHVVVGDDLDRGVDLLNGGGLRLSAGHQRHQQVLEVVLDGEEDVVPASDHGHSGREVADHVVGGLTHALVVVRSGH